MLHAPPQFVRVLMNMAKDLGFFSIAWIMLILAFRPPPPPPFPHSACGSLRNNSSGGGGGPCAR
jgi:hypothetical protein